MATLKVDKCPNDSLAVTNRVYVAPGVFPQTVKHIAVSTEVGEHVLTLGVSDKMVCHTPAGDPLATLGRLTSVCPLETRMSGL